MDKYLLIDLEVVDQVKVKKLLDALLDATESDGMLVNCIAIRARQGVLDTMKEFFGGSIVIVGGPQDQLPPAWKSQLAHQSPAPDAVVELSKPFQKLRDQVNEQIDTIISEQDAEFLSEARTTPALLPKAAKKPLVKMAQAKPSKEIKAWRVIVNGAKTEIITISEKNRRLAAGEFETGTQLHHPKAGLQNVTGRKGQPQGMDPI